MKQFTLGGYTLDDFADYTNGLNNYFAGIEGNQLIVSGQHKLTKTINMHFPLTISGDNATILGERSDIYAFAITSSNTTVEHLTLDNFKFGIEVDGAGHCVQDVVIDDITMNLGLRLADIGSTLSNSILRNIKVTNCTATVAPEDWSDSDGSGEMSLCYNICAARHAGGDAIGNCLIEGVLLDNCKKIGFSTAGISVVTGMPKGTDYSVMGLSYSNLVVRNITVSNNFVDTCWDCCLVVIGAFINTGKGLVEDIKIIGNHCKYGIGAIGVTAGGHHFGDRGQSVVRGVKINNNTVERSIDKVGEPSWAIWAYGCRDYFPGTSTHDHLVENVEIAHDTVIGAGIALKGAYVLLDVPATQTNNTVNNVSIHHNNISNADYAFELYGIDIHGRLYDWNYGYPPHDQQWGELITDDSTVCAQATGNKLTNISICHNTIEGYRYRVRACGAKAHGHGMCTDNKVVDNIEFENNSYGVGENHIHVAGIIADDFVVDNGGNEVSAVFKNK